ncbi:MAG TPA: protein translocase subunit SecD [Clostridiales bacterium]|nr:protein translocase subunit SecD [Clostridiales bacterium]
MAKRSFAKTGVQAKPTTFFIVAAIILIALVISITGLKIPIPGQTELLNLYSMAEIRFGIDIRGGVEAVFAPRDFTGNASADQLAAARNVIEERMDNLNILDREITIDENSGQIIVRFPWQSGETEFNPEEALLELGEMALLEFVDPDGKVVITGADVIKASAGYITNELGNSEIVVELNLNESGKTKFAEATKRLKVGNQILKITMDGATISSPRVNDEITNGVALISPMSSNEEAVDLAQKISAGALPFALEAISSSSISPTLGKDALAVMTTAGLVAFILICLFMLIYYRLPGFIACWSLLAQIVGILLAISIPQQTLTLQGIAGIILSIGMGVDANVIIAERIKEELKNGASLTAALANGFNRALSSVVDGNVTVAIAAIILMIFGSGSMLSFGYSLLVGVILNSLTGVIASRLMIGSLSQFKPLRNTWLYGARREKANA